jgi:acyl-CoA synthetase (AMP-forming)/AMP-acid ligase II
VSIGRADTLLTEERIRRYEDEGYWGLPTFPDLLRRNARECPEHVAYSDARGSLTWAALWQQCQRLTGHLMTMDVRRGDVVAIQLSNRLEFIVALGAVNALGAVACPYPVALRRAEVSRILSFSQAVVAIVPQRDRNGFDYVDMLLDLKPELPELRCVIVVDGTDDLSRGVRAFSTLMASDATVPGFAERLSAVAPGVHDVNRILFTSGSTGEPKAVLHTYATSLISNYQFNERYDVDENSVLALFIPITLNWGLFQVFQTAIARCHLILVDDFDPELLLTLVAGERITHLGGPPTAIVAILASPSLHAHDLASLRYYVTAGSSCPVSLLHQVRREIGCSIIEAYGMTECGWISATGKDDDLDSAAGTVGTAYPGMEIRLMDPKGDGDVPGGEPGEIAMRGPMVCVGYYGNADLNKTVFTPDGWFRSGDLGLIDEAGRLRIVGRSKDLIKHGGSSILPRELEELLLDHPKIADVAIVGVADSYFGENVCACVVPRPGASIELPEVIGFLSGKIARYKLPQRLETFERLPYTETGKVLKHVIHTELDQRAAGAAAPAPEQSTR